MRRGLSWIAEKGLGFVTVGRGKEKEVEKMRRGLSWIAEKGLGLMVGRKKEVEKMRKGLSVIVGIAILLFAYSASATDVVTSNLVSWWKFDETSGTNASDSKGDNTGTLYNFDTPAWTTDTAGGASSGALYFEHTDTDEYVRVEHNASLNPSNFTLEAWVCMNDLWGENIIVQKGATYGNPGYALGFNGDKIRFNIGRTGAETLLDSTTTLQTGTWYHVAVTYDGTNQKIYIDSVKETNEATPLSYETSLDAMYIGHNGRNQIDVFAFSGIMDDVRIYNKALNLGEIQQNYDAIPEPSTLLLLGAGLSGLLAFRRIKAKD